MLAFWVLVKCAPTYERQKLYSFLTAFLPSLASSAPQYQKCTSTPGRYDSPSAIQEGHSAGGCAGDAQCWLRHLWVSLFRYLSPLHIC